MKIEAVDFFYLRMPVIEDIGDGSQDALLVRTRGGGHEMKHPQAVSHHHQHDEPCQH